MKFESLHDLIDRLETDLLVPARLRNRIEALDELDAHFFGAGTGGEFTSPSADSATLERAATLRSRLEAANTEIYSAIGSDIRHGNPDNLRNWICQCRNASDDIVPGLGYDYLDELISGVFLIAAPLHEAIGPVPEQIFYQPTPVRHVLTMIERTGLSADDVLIDFGSGLGQLCILSSILTGARTIGIEIEAAYVGSARACARNLRLDGVVFLHSDGREAELSSGTVFHLYTPFTGSILRTVLNRLKQESTKRSITISTFGPCTDAVAQEPWLRADAQLGTDHVTVFRSRDGWV